MKRALVLLSGVVLTTVGCFGAIEGGEDGDRTEGAWHSSVSSASVKCVYDAGCDGVPYTRSVRVTLDGRTCTADAPGAGLSLGLDGNGWEVSVASADCGIILNVSGLDDAAYPQTTASSFLGQSRIMLFTGESMDGIDGGISGLYESNAGGTVTVDRGPSHGMPRSVSGHAHVLAPDGHAAHDIVFAMDY